MSNHQKSTKFNNIMGKKFGKYDMDRVGLFSEMPYMTGDKYSNKNVNDVRDLKNSQMYPGILKTKTGLQDAYFDKKYKRLFENEKWFRPKKTIKSNNTIKPFLPTSYTKHHSTPGDSFGTFGPKYTAMSNKKRPSNTLVEKLPNFKTIPTNTSGPGYTDRGINPFPIYISTPYGKPKKIKINSDNTIKKIPFLNAFGNGKFFDKNPYFNSVIQRPYKYSFKKKFEGTPFLPSSSIKKFGNRFDRYPSHMVDPYKTGGGNYKADKKVNSVQIFYPQTRNKSFYTVSILQRKLNSAHNNTNWKTFEPITYRMK